MNRLLKILFKELALSSFYMKEFTVPIVKRLDLTCGCL